MKIAVTYENGEVFQHFGHTEQFKIYDIVDGKVVSTEIIDTGDSGHGALAEFLKERDVRTLVCGGIGGGAKNMLNAAGITLYPGVTGNADDCINALAAGKLNYDPNTQCTDHEHEPGSTCSNHNTCS